jgi:hypothetical protein
MKKIKFIVIVAITPFLFGTSVQANLCSRQNDFTHKFRIDKFTGLRPVQQCNAQPAIYQDFVFSNTAIDSFTSTGDADKYMTICTAEPSVFQRYFNFGYNINSMPATSPSPEPPLPEPPSPLPTLPGT